jgi:hypothetical protein
LSFGRLELQKNAPNYQQDAEMSALPLETHDAQVSNPGWITQIFRAPLRTTGEDGGTEDAVKLRALVVQALGHVT